MVRIEPEDTDDNETITIGTPGGGTVEVDPTTGDIVSDSGGGTDDGSSAGASREDRRGISFPSPDSDRDTSGSLAEPEVDRESRRVSTAQDRDLREVRRREAGASREDRRGVSFPAPEPEPVDAEPPEEVTAEEVTQAARERVARGEPDPAVEAQQPDEPIGIEEAGTGEGGQVRAVIDGEAVEGTGAEVAQAFEASVVEDDPRFGPEDIRIVETDEGFGVEITGQAQRRIAAEEIERDLAFGAEDIPRGALRGPGGERPEDVLPPGVDVDLTEADIVETDEGFTLTPEARERVTDEQLEVIRQTEQRVNRGGDIDDLESEAAERVEQQVESQFRLRQAERLGITDPRLRAGLAGPDIDFGPDDIRLVPGDPQTVTEDGVSRTVTTFDVELTARGEAKLERLERIEAEQQLELQILEQTGRSVDLEAEDIEFTDEGVRLTAQGRTKVATQPLTEAVEAAETGILGTGVDVPQFTLEQVAPGPGGVRQQPAGTARIEVEDLLVDVERTVFGERPITPGPGVAPRERITKAPVVSGGPIAEDVGETRDLGQVDIELPIFGDRPVTPGPRAAPRERVGTTTVEEVLQSVDADIAEAIEFETLPAGKRPVTPGRGVAPRERVPFEEAPREHQLAALTLESGAEAAPRFLTGGAILAKDLADFSAAVAEATTPEFTERPVTAGPRAAARTRVAGPDIERVDQLVTDAGQAAANTVAVGAAGAIEEPAETAARATGTLATSAVLFGGAAAIGPRASLAARGIIQPGEEAAGIGGFAATRAVAGRGAAQRLFPDKEPLIFSEEAFLRGVRATSGRVSGRLSSVRIPRIETARLEESFGELRTEATLLGIESGMRFGVPRIEIEAETEAPVRRTQTDVDRDVSDALESVDRDVEGRGDGGGRGGRFVDVERRDPGTGQVEVLRKRVEAEPIGRPAEFESAVEEESLGIRVQPGDLGGGLEDIGELGRVSPGEAAEAVEAVGEAPLFEHIGDDILEIERELDDVVELGLEGEFEGEGEREGEIMRESEREGEAEAELEVEVEIEQELELLEQELEQELEAEVEPGGEPLEDFEPRRAKSDVEFFSRLFEFERTEDPFVDIEAELDAIDKELEDLA